MLKSRTILSSLAALSLIGPLSYGEDSIARPRNVPDRESGRHRDRRAQFTGYFATIGKQRDNRDGESARQRKKRVKAAHRAEKESLLNMDFSDLEQRVIATGRAVSSSYDHSTTGRSSNAPVIQELPVAF